MALNRQAVITYVRQQPPANFIDINRTVALISDTTTFIEDYRLYTDLESVETDFPLKTEEFYLMAKGYFNETGGNGYLYAVPVRGLDGSDPDVVGTLTLIENDPSLVWAVVVADKTIRESAHIIAGTLAAAKYNQAYHMMFETNDLTTKTAGVTDPAYINKAVYDSLTGNNAFIVGNMSFFYTEVTTDPLAVKMAGIMMGQNIGSRTAKFAKPLLSNPTALTGAELQFLSDKNVNVYTGTNEVTGRAFMKEGMSLKTGNFIDTSLGAIWMEVNLTAICYDLFQQKKVTIDNQGFALLENATKPVFKLAQIYGIIQAGEDAYTIRFAKDLTVIRGILGTYTYNEAVAGHFLTNNVEIK